MLSSHVIQPKLLSTYTWEDSLEGARRLHVRTDEAETPDVQDATPPLRWVAGGGTYVVNNEWVPLVMRCQNARSNPGKLTIATGVSSTHQECLQPWRMLRELFEEIHIYRQGRLLVPELVSTEPYFSAFGAGPTHNIFKRLYAIAGVSMPEVESVPMTLMEPLLAHEIWINGSATCRALVHADGESCNLLYAVSLRGTPIQELTFRDMEIHHEALLQRPIMLYNLQTSQLYNPDLTPARQPFEFTSHASFLLQALKEAVTQLRAA